MDYLKTIQESWEGNIYGNPMYILHQKIKRMSKNLSIWSKLTFGDIYETPKKLEVKIIIREDNCVNNYTLEKEVRFLDIRLNSLDISKVKIVS